MPGSKQTIADRMVLRNATGVSESVLEELVREFLPLKELKPDLPDRVVRYAVDGVHEEVLDELRQGLGIFVGLSFLPILVNAESRKLVEAVASTSREFLERLGEVYQAMSEHQRLPAVPDIPGWLVALVHRALFATPYSRRDFLHVGPIEAFFGAAGLGPEVLVRVAFLDDPNGDRYVRLTGFSELVGRHPEPVLAALQHKDAQHRERGLDNLAVLDLPLDPFAEAIVGCLLSSSKKVREAAQPLARKLGEAAWKLVAAKLTAGTAEERVHAAKLLSGVPEYQREDFWQEVLAGQKAERAKTAIKEVLAYVQELDQPAAASPESRSVLERPSVTAHAPGITSTCFPAFKEIFDEYNRRIQPVLNSPRLAYARLRTFSEDEIRAAFNLVECGAAIHAQQIGDLTGFPSGFLCREVKPSVARRIKEFSDQHALQLVDLIRLLQLLGFIQWQPGQDWLSILPYTKEFIEHWAARRGVSIDLGVVGDACTVAGIPDDMPGREYLRRFSFIASWGEDFVWPYFTSRVALLEEVLGIREPAEPLRDWELPMMRRKSLEIVARFPEVPSSLLMLLWELALGSAKTNRLLAQQILDKVPGSEARVIEALKNRKEETRAVAAEWLGRNRCEPARAALRRALDKENSDRVRAALMSALESLGVPLSELVNPKGLVKEAEKGLKSGIPADLTWFPFDELPMVRWADTGEPVADRIITWWIVQHFKLKEPEPSPLMRRFAALLEAWDREQLASFVLKAWIARDTEPLHTREDAEGLAERAAQQMMASFAGMFTYEKLFRDAVNGFLNKCKQSAIKEKGILAVSAACGGRGIVPLAERYLKRWHGLRAAQCKALVRMLSWCDHPLAIQLLLSVAARFRTKGIQQEADVSVKALAERKGWTTDELADRTIPTAGFEDEPEILLDYGDRTFSVTLDDKLGLVVRDPAGKMVKSLPEPRKGDDPEKVKEAKKHLSQIKTELKSVAKIQRDRLYEAMCLQRSWRFEDWDTYLFRHPLIGRYCRRLVWVAFREEEPFTRFRPLDDGSLTDAQDEEVTLGLEDLLKVAHTCNTHESECRAWLKHLSEYEVEPLFDQFSRPMYALTGEKGDETEIDEFVGHLIDAFTLRGAAAGMGYVRGPAADGGWFFAYEKLFPGVSLKAVVDFSGNPLPETNRVVALGNLSFYGAERRVPGAEFQERPVKLSEVPTVLLSDCYNDLRIIASKGKGFDPDWERKVEP